MEISTVIAQKELKTIMKTAIIEVLTERKELFAKIFHGVIEGYYLGLTIDEGLKGEDATREEIFAAFNED